MREINITVETCSECPYCEYDCDYGMSYDSGYDCNNSGETIVTDGGMKRNNINSDNIPIPEWCKLKIVDPVIINRQKKL